MASSSATETDSLLHSGSASNEEEGLIKRDGDLFRSFRDLAVTVVENEDHEPVVIHDLCGPVLLEGAGLERSDSIMSSICTEVPSAKALAEFEQHDGHRATISEEIASMTKNLIGCGALSLCNGIALCANTPKAIFPAIFWISAMGCTFGYFCWVIAKVCELTKRSTYRSIWQETVGHKGSTAVSVANALKAGLADLAYATILADTLNSLFASIHVHVPRLICLFLITIVGILPLCLLKNLAVLAPFSIVGTTGMLLTTLAMAIRYFDGSYQEGGRYYDDIELFYRPNFGHVDRSWTTGILPFVCMVYEAYVMHYNSPRFYTELKNKSLPRFGVAVGSSFTLSAVLYAGIASFGFLTFGGNSSSYILNNYSPHDPLATVSRLAVGISTLIAYPIVFMGVRDGFLDIFEVPLSEQTSHKLNQLTFILLGFLTVTAVFVTDLGLINAVGGGLVSTAIVFVFPTIMFHEAVKQTSAEWKEVALTSGLTVLGVIFGVVGAWTAVMGTSMQ